MNKESVKIGVVGLGSMGAKHVERILGGRIPGCSLTAVCDTDPAASDRIASANLQKFISGEDMIRSGEIEAVVIATPHYSHTTLGILALENGIHVLTEKPISVHKADAERLVQASRGKNLIFGAMFDMRTDPRYRKLHAMVKSGELGRIRRINWSLCDWFRSDAYYASSPWRATWGGEGGGLLVNQLPHDLDLFQWIFGMPETVRGFCKIGKYHDIEVEDEITAYFEYPDGTTAVLIASTGEAPGTDRRELVAENGRVVVGDQDLIFSRNLTPMTEFSRTTTSKFDKPLSEEVIIPCEGTATRHDGILANFIQAILTGEPLIAPGEEGIHSVELANAITLSSQQGQTLRLPLDSAVYESFLTTKIASSRYSMRSETGVFSG